MLVSAGSQADLKQARKKLFTFLLTMWLCSHMCMKLAKVMLKMSGSSVALAPANEQLVKQLEGSHALSMR